MRIVCDCDLVIAPADVPWLEYLNAVSGKNIQFNTTRKEVEYDITLYFPNFQNDYGISPMSYWDRSHLYDTMGVIKGANTVLNGWSEQGNFISIASHTKGGHFSSKYRYTNRVLDKVDFGRGTGNGFFATKEKYLLPCKYAIDDRAENLVLFGDDVIKIYFNTIYIDPYLEDLKKCKNVFITSIETPWEDIVEFLKERKDYGVS